MSLTTRDLYIEHSASYGATSASWDNVHKHKMMLALFALRRILGKPDVINGRHLK